jgi:hypothetical protein
VALCEVVLQARRQLVDGRLVIQVGLVEALNAQLVLVDQGLCCQQVPLQPACTQRDKSVSGPTHYELMINI